MNAGASEFQGRTVEGWVQAISSGEVPPSGLFEAFPREVRLFTAALQHMRPEVRATAALQLSRLADAFDFKTVLKRDAQGHPRAWSIHTDSEEYDLYTRAAREVVPFLAGALGDPDLSVKRNAARALVSLSQEAEDAIPALVEALGFDDEWLRMNLLIALSNMGPAAGAGAPVFIRLLRDETLSEEIRKHAVWTLGSAHSGGEESIAALLKALSKGSESLKAAATSALGSFGPTARAAIPIVEEATSSSDPSVRRRAYDALFQIDPGKHARSIRALKDPDPEVRLSVVCSLGRRAENRAESLPHLFEAMRDPDPRVRSRATGEVANLARWLGGSSVLPITREEMVERLKERLRDEDPAARSAAAWCLGNWRLGDAETHVLLKEAAKKAAGTPRNYFLSAIANSKVDDPDTRDFLREATADPSVSTRADAIYRLASLPDLDESSVEVLRKALCDPNSWVRYRAAEGLIGLEPHATEAEKTLREMLLDPNKEMRCIAAIQLLTPHPDDAELTDILLDGLRDRSENLRRIAISGIRALGRLNNRIESALKALLASPEDRFTAAWALSFLGSDEETLAGILASELGSGETITRRAAMEGLAEMGDRAITALEKALQDADPRVRELSARALEKLRGASS
jgi:HEAT repeat protein